MPGKNYFGAASLTRETKVLQHRRQVSRSNVYIVTVQGSSAGPNRQLLKNVAAYITKIFDVLGLMSRPEDIGFSSGGDQGANVSIT
jgi:hypothetical protein